MLEAGKLLEYKGWEIVKLGPGAFSCVSVANAHSGEVLFSGTTLERILKGIDEGDFKNVRSIRPLREVVRPEWSDREVPCDWEHA